MTDTPHTLWMAASTRPLDEIETMRCDAPECEIVQEFRALFNEIHRLRARLRALLAAIPMQPALCLTDLSSLKHEIAEEVTFDNRSKPDVVQDVFTAFLERFTLVPKP